MSEDESNGRQKLTREIIWVVVAAVLGAGGGQGVGHLISPQPQIAASDWTSIRDDVRSLKQYHAQEWPLERQLLGVNMAQNEMAIQVNSAEINDLKDSIQELQDQIKELQ